MLDAVTAETAAVLGHTSASSFSPDRAFKDIGLDSLASVELRNRIAGFTGLRLPATVVFDYPNPASLAEYVLGEVVSASSATPAVPAVVTADTSGDPVVIVGMACRYGGGIDSPEALWAMVEEGGTPPRSSRPTAAGTWPSCSIPSRAAWVRRMPGLRPARRDRFDPEFFGISPRQATATDRAATVARVGMGGVQRAGIDPSALRGTKTGVFVGLSTTDNSIARARIARPEGHLLTGTGASVASGRIAYEFGLEGSAVTVDTACSSSLTAMHMAAQALRSAECNLALAGGVAVMATPVAFQEFALQGGLSPTAAAGRSARTRTALAGPRASGCSCWSVSRPPAATATRSSGRSRSPP